MIPVAILCRVSTKKQETDRQESELREVAAKNGWDVTDIIRETVSGRSSKSDRFDLAKVRALAESGRISKVLVHEVSRISRKNSVTHELVEDLSDLGVSLYWHAQKIETLMENGKRNPAAGMMLALLAEIARNEVETLSERIKSGIDEARRKGTQIGRKPGFGRDLPAAEFRSLLNSGKSYRAAAKILGYPVSSLRSALRRSAA